MFLELSIGKAGEIKSMTDIMLPVMEQAMLLAGEYCKACGRDVILPEDMEYAVKYCAMYTVGQQIGTHFPEIYDTDDDEEEDDDTSSDAELAKGYEYLLGMKIWSLTFEKAEKLRQELGEKAKELEELQGTEPSQIWLNDLDAIEAAL